MIDISTKIKKLRLERNLKQKDVAKALNIATNTLSQFENNNGRPSLDVLSSMADFFECSVDYLVGREDEFGNVTVSTLLSNGLNGQEEELIKNFRLLNSYQKDALALQAQIMADDSLKLEKK